MFHFDSLPETQAALALSIFFATLVYEDGATLLAATLSASGRLDPRIGLLTAFLGIWIGDIGLYGLGSVFGRHTAQSRWLQKYLKPESLAMAQAWFAKHGSLALVMSRAIPGSRLPHGRWRAKASRSALCQDYRSLFGCLGFRHFCDLAVCPQSI